MIELAEFKEDTGQYYGDREPVHRAQLEIKIRDPTPVEAEALQHLLLEFFTKVRIKSTKKVFGSPERPSKTC